MSNQITIPTTEELRELYLNDLRKELSLLKKEFQPKEPTEYLTRNEVKDLLKVDLSTIYNWTKKGKLKAYGLGNRVYFKRSEIEKTIVPLNIKS